MSSDAPATRRGAWLWSAPADLAAFGGSALLAIALVALGPRLAGPDGALPTWGFLAFVVAVDVAHVWATLFRTYLDPLELARRPSLYLFTPFACFLAGAALHAVDASWFWRGLAYVAVLHFVRQQAGWVAIYRARAGLTGAVDRVVDDAVVYASTLVPLAHWHAELPRAIAWFVDGDFVATPWLAPALPVLDGLWLVTAVAYLARAIVHAREGRLPWGKHLVVATTAATWWLGIVATDTDFQFTAANVLVHGVPYFFLLHAYARRRAAEGNAGLVGTLLRGGVVGFVAVLQLLAFAEELAWDRLVWHARPEVFGGSGGEALDEWTAVLVPLLAVPQATHYVLDAVLWRRRETGPAQAGAMGFAGPPASASA